MTERSNFDRSQSYTNFDPEQAFEIEIEKHLKEQSYDSVEKAAPRSQMSTGGVVPGMGT